MYRTFSNPRILLSIAVLQLNKMRSLLIVRVCVDCSCVLTSLHRVSLYVYNIFHLTYMYITYIFIVFLANFYFNVNSSLMVIKELPAWDVRNSFIAHNKPMAIWLSVSMCPICFRVLGQFFVTPWRLFSVSVFNYVLAGNFLPENQIVYG